MKKKSENNGEKRKIQTLFKKVYIYNKGFWRTVWDYLIRILEVQDNGEMTSKFWRKIIFSLEGYIMPKSTVWVEYKDAFRNSKSF
jgi:hypothetical protein